MASMNMLYFSRSSKAVRLRARGARLRLAGMLDFRLSLSRTSSSVPLVLAFLRTPAVARGLAWVPDARIAPVIRVAIFMRDGGAHVPIRTTEIASLSGYGLVADRPPAPEVLHKGPEASLEIIGNLLHSACLLVR